MAGEVDPMLKTAQSGGTYADLAKQAQLFEDPMELLEVDPLRWDPDGTQSRMEKITNVLLDLFRQQGDLQSQITKLGVRSGDDYKNARSTLYLVEAKIAQLEKKFDTLKNRSYTKRQEWKSTP
jgi:hypothetical protein